MSKTALLMGASALVAASLAFAGAASAKTSPPPPPTTLLYGTGSSLDAPYLNEIESCYGETDVLDVQSAQGPTSTGYFEPAPTICKTPFQTPNQLHFMSSSSGYGQAALFTNSPSYAGLTYQNVYYPGIEYAAGDYGLAPSDVNVYNNGGCESSGSTYFNVAAPGGGTVGNCSGSPYPNPLASYGPLVQLPILVTAVAIAYNPVYSSVGGTSYSFNIHTPNKDKSGGLLLDMPTVCAIFNGQITNWNDPALTALNGGVSLKDPSDPNTFSVPIEIVGRSDSSGTTSIFYRALAAQCGSASGTTTYTEGGDNYTYTNQYQPGGSHTLPSTLLSGNTWPGTGPTEPVTPGKFTTVKGSPGIAAYLAIPLSSGQQQGKLAYIGPDYTLPAVTKTGYNTYNLNIADIKVTYGKKTASYEPTDKNALTAFGKLLPPQTTSAGAYSAGALTNGLRANPQDWAEPTSITETIDGGTIPTPLAIPTAGYPIVGTSNGFFYTCYKSSAQAAAIASFLAYYETNKETKTILNDAGLALLPEAWIDAIQSTFLSTGTGNAAPDGEGLTITTAGSAGACASVVGAN